MAVRVPQVERAEPSDVRSHRCSRAVARATTASSTLPHLPAPRARGEIPAYKSSWWSKMTDPIADMLTRIRNACARHPCVEAAQGYVRSETSATEVPGSAARQRSTIVLKYGRATRAPSSACVARSRPGRRVYVGHNELPEVLTGLGISILSTSRGVHDRQGSRAASRSAASCCARFGDGQPHSAQLQRQSRVGKRPIAVPKGVEVKRRRPQRREVKGPEGHARARRCPPLVTVKKEGESLIVSITPDAGREGPQVPGPRARARRQHGRGRRRRLRASRSSSSASVTAAEVKGKRAQARARPLAPGAVHAARQRQRRASRSSTRAAPRGRACTSTRTTRSCSARPRRASARSARRSPTRARACATGREDSREGRQGRQGAQG